MRWLGLRVKYLNNSGDEKLRPMVAAFDLADHALEKEGLDDDPDMRAVRKRLSFHSAFGKAP